MGSSAAVRISYAKGEIGRATVEAQLNSTRQVQAGTDLVEDRTMDAITTHRTPDLRDRDAAGSRRGGWGLAASVATLLLAAAPAWAQSAQNFPSGSIFFQPLTPPSTPKVHPYVPPVPPSLSGETAGIAGSSLPPGAAGVRPPPALLGYTTDCNAVSGGTASGRTSATTALDCVPMPAAGYDRR
jgi:hypothetical protein